jgi:predicted tellurium resistance membrane protein TerC
VPIEAQIMIARGLLLLALAILFAVFPKLLIYPLTNLVWIAGTLLYRGYKLHYKSKRKIR